MPGASQDSSRGISRGTLYLQGFHSHPALAEVVWVNRTPKPLQRFANAKTAEAVAIIGQSKTPG